VADDGSYFAPNEVQRRVAALPIAHVNAARPACAPSRLSQVQKRSVAGESVERFGAQRHEKWMHAPVDCSPTGLILPVVKTWVTSPE